MLVAITSGYSLDCISSSLDFADLANKIDILISEQSYSRSKESSGDTHLLGNLSALMSLVRIKGSVNRQMSIEKFSSKRKECSLYKFTCEVWIVEVRL